MSLSLFLLGPDIGGSGEQSTTHFGRVTHETQFEIEALAFRGRAKVELSNAKLLAPVEQAFDQRSRNALPPECAARIDRDERPITPPGFARVGPQSRSTTPAPPTTSPSLIASMPTYCSESIRALTQFA